MDAANIMLSALIEPEDQTKTPENSLSTDEQIKYLMKNANSVPRETRQDLARVIRLNGYESTAQDGKDGLIINLAKIPPHVIDTMYEILSHKIDSLRV